MAKQSGNKESSKSASKSTRKSSKSGKSSRSKSAKSKKSEKSKSQKSQKSKSRSKSSRKSSKSSHRENVVPISTKSSSKTEPRMVYQANEERAPIQQAPNFSRKFNASLQAFITGFVLIATVFQLLLASSDDHSSQLIFVLILEMIGCMLTIHRHTTGISCVNLIFQYTVTFLTFSLFLEVDVDTRRGFFECFFSLPTTCAIAATCHMVITMFSIEVIATAEKRKDYGNLVIVESTEKRKRDLFQLVTALMSNVCDGDEGMNMQLKVQDETGKPMQLSGANVGTGANRTVQLKIRENSLKLSTSNSVAATIKMPEDGVQQNVQQTVFNSPFNNCQRQEDMLSPRKVL